MELSSFDFIKTFALTPYFGGVIFLCLVAVVRLRMYR
jgi:hypothetical protein